MTREHLYPRIWKTTDLQRLNTITQLDRNAGLLVKCESRPGDCANSIYEYPLASRHGLEDLNVKHYFASQGRRFVEVFDHHLTQTPVEHIDRAKVITGSDGIDFPTMRIARLLEELSLTATDRTDAELECQRLRHEFAEKCKESTDYEVEMKNWRERCEKAEREVKSLHEINMHLGRERKYLRTESVELREREQALNIAAGQAAAMRSQEIDKLTADVKLFRSCNQNQCETIQRLRRELAVAREELSATNTRNATQAATIREYQAKEDAADAQPDAIQDLRRRVGKVERFLVETHGSTFGVYH